MTEMFEENRNIFIQLTVKTPPLTLSVRIAITSQHLRGEKNSNHERKNDVFPCGVTAYLGFI